MKLKQIFLVILLSVGLIHSIFIPINHPPQPNPEQQTGGCLGPINFSVEKNCRLTYYSTYSVNTFDCDLNQNSDSYKITGDCRGGVISTQYTSHPPLSQLNIITYILITIVSLVLMKLCFQS